MKDYLPIIIVGIASGSIVAIAAMGLVLTYKASGIFNFAQGAISTLAAGVFYQLHVLNGVSWPIAGLATLAIIGLGCGLVMERVAQLLAPANTTMKVIATVGIMITVTSFFSLRYGDVVKTFPSYLPDGSFLMLGAYVGYGQVIVVIVGLACAIGMTVFFRYTRRGRAIRAVVDDPDLVSIAGINPAAVRRYAWVIGASFAAIAGMLIAPSVGLDGRNLTLLVVAGFGAAAIGRFTSLPLTYLGAVLIETTSAVVSKWTAPTPSLHSLPTAIPFLVLFIALLVTSPRRLIAVGTQLERRVPRSPHPQFWAGSARLAVTVLALGVVPQLVGIHVLAWTQGLVVAILMLSLSLLVRTANEISLCQMTFAAIGAVVFYRLSDAGMPWVVCVVVAGIAAIPAGLAVSVTAIRLSGVYLALATLSFGLVVQSVFYPTSLMFGESGLPVFVPRPSWALDDAQYYYLVLAALLVCYGIVRAIEGARLGRFLQAKSDANHALVGLGVRTPALSMAVFCVAAGLAGIAGALTGPIFQVVGVGNFQAFPNSLLLVTLFVLGARSPGIGSLGASLIAAIALIVIPDYIHSATVLNSLNLLFGLAALEAAVASTGQSPFSRMLTRVTKRKQRTMSRRNDTELGSVPGDPWSESNLLVTDRKRPTSSSKATSWPTR